MRLLHGIGLAVFCLLAGSRWLVDAAWPPMLPPLLASSMAFMFLGLVALIGVVLRKRVSHERKPRLFYVCFAGLLLFSVPALAQTYAAAIQQETGAAFYAMVPLGVVVIFTLTGNDVRTAMMPALVGLAGALLLLPWQLPYTGVGVAALGLVLAGILATATGCVWLYKVFQGGLPMRSVVLIAWSNAAALCAAGVLRGERISAFNCGDFASILIDLPALILLLWLVSELAPEQLAARFFLVPLVTVAEGAAMLRPRFDARMAIAVLLLLFGAGTLLFGKRETGLSLGLR